MILFRCLAKCFPTFPIKVRSKKIFFIQILTLCYNSSMTPELYHILLKNVILFSRPFPGAIAAMELYVGITEGVPGPIKKEIMIALCRDYSVDIDQGD